jgi:parallel beta-helix repeat protein
MITLDQVEARTPLPPPGFDPASDFPIRITQSGSYYLTRDIAAAGTPGPGGIVIETDNVALDLNGFALIGPPLQAGETSDDGISIIGFSNISISNGTVRDWGDEGIDADAAFACQFRDIILHNNGRIQVPANGHGMTLGSGSVVRHCTATGNFGDGIMAPLGATIFQSAAMNNGGSGFSLANGSLVTESVAHTNGNHGFLAGSGSNIMRCTTATNASDGYFLTASQVTDSTAYDNGEVGIQAQAGSLVQRCTVRSNDSFGIALAEFGSGGNTVLENTVSFNGGIGIFVRLNNLGNRIEGNNVYANQVAGIRTLGRGNLVVRNTARANGDTGITTDEYQVDSEDAFGGELNGTSGSSFVTDRPWINFLSPSI